MSLIINDRQHPGIPATNNANPVDGTLSEGAYAVEAGDEPVPDSFNPPTPEPAAEPAQAAEPSQPQDILAWSRETLAFNPDPFQSDLLTATNSRVLVLAPRQTGKSTAAAVRVLYEAIHHDNALILLASASGRQSGQIMEKVRKMAHEIGQPTFPPPNKCDGFTLENGAQIIAVPDSQETIRGFSAPRLIIVDEAAFASEEMFKALEPMLTVSAGTLLLMSTPNGQFGYFYDQWHNTNGPWKRLQGQLKDCPRVDWDTIEEMRQTMAPNDFAQEFECRFVAAAGQFISREAFRQCIRADVKPFFPEDDMDSDI